MSKVDNLQIRPYVFNPLATALGLAAVQAVCEFTTVKNTEFLQFGAYNVVTTVPANDPLTAAWLISVQIIVNQTEQVVDPMGQANYVNVVQNVEMQEADIISNGHMLWKRFSPPLPPNTKVQIILVINTLALGTTTPAATANLNLVCLAYDSKRTAARRLTYYKAITPIPAPTIVAGTSVRSEFGVNARVEKALIITELTVAALSDTFTGILELVADGQPVITLNAPAAKQHYSIITDGLAPPAGFYAMKAPAEGFQASQSAQLALRCTPHTTAATGNYAGWEIFEKGF